MDVTTSDGALLSAPAGGDCWIWSSASAVIAAAWIWRDGFYWCQSWPAEDLVERSVAQAAVFGISPGVVPDLRDDRIIRLDWLRTLLALAQGDEYHQLVEHGPSLAPRDADTAAPALVRRLVASGLTQAALLTSLSWPSLTVETFTADPDPQVASLIAEQLRRNEDRRAREASAADEARRQQEATRPPRDPVAEDRAALITAYGTSLLTEEDFVAAVLDGVTQWHLHEWVTTLIDAVTEVADSYPPDRRALTDLLHATMDLRRGDVSPFAGLMEAPRTIIALYRKHGQAMVELTELRDRAYDPLLRDLSAALYRQHGTPIPWSDLIAHGATPVRPPAPDVEEW